MDTIDKLLSEDNDENIILYNEQNEETEFEQCAIIPMNEKIYAILKPVTPMEGVDDDTALVFVIEEIDDEEMLVIVNDDSIVEAVFEIYYDLLREEGIEIE